MGWKFRKSIRLSKGVRFNINKNSVGVSAGGNGIRYSVNSDGRKTSTIGVPGTGLYYTESSKNKAEQEQIKDQYSIFKILLAFMTCGISILFIGLKK